MEFGFEGGGFVGEEGELGADPFIPHFTAFQNLINFPFMSVQNTLHFCYFLLMDINSWGLGLFFDVTEVSYGDGGREGGEAFHLLLPALNRTAFILLTFQIPLINFEQICKIIVVQKFDVFFVCQNFVGLETGDWGG